MDSLNRLVVCASERNHHEGDLRDRGERQDTLDVDLCAGHDCGVECRDGADHADEGQRVGNDAEEREEAGHEVDAGNDHRSGVDQGRYRGRALHGVGKPDVERHHGRLTHTADEDQHHRPGQHGAAHERCAECRGQNIGRLRVQHKEVER